MDKLPAEKQQELSKMNTDRLRTRLVNVGYDEETLVSLERKDLLEMYAEHLLSPTVETTGEATGGVTDEEFRWRQEEIDLRKQELQLRRMEMETRKAEIERQIQRDAQELKLRELELERQIRKDEEDKKRKESLVGQTRFYGDALKHALPRMGSDPADYPAYFCAVENLFRIYEVPAHLQSKLLIPMLNERSKALLAKLQREKLDDYIQVRNYLLREFKLSAEQYRDRFWTTTKTQDETFTLFGSRVKNLFLYYLDSRKAASKDDVIDLMVADRIKQTLSDSCLRYVLAAEGADWFKPEKLTDVIDVYVNSHLNINRNVVGGVKPSKPQGVSAGNGQKINLPTTVTEKTPPIRCFVCNKLGHRAMHCRERRMRSEISEKSGTKTASSAKVSHVSVKKTIHTNS